MTRTQRLLLSLTASAALVAAPAVRADTKDDVEALRAEVKRLEAEVKALQGAKPAAEPARDAAAPAEAGTADRLDLLEVKQGDAVVKGDIPGSFRIPGTEISLRLYGYAELDWVHAFSADNSDIDYSTFAPYLPLKGSPEANRGGRDYLTVRESRVGLESGMPTRYGVLSVKIEGDFNNEPRTGNSAVYGTVGNIYTQQATNSYGFRIRHAYGQFGGLLVGQTWSTFMDVDNFPETVDYNGPVGGTFIRQPMIRYAYATPKAGTFTAALENSDSYVLQGDPAGSPDNKVDPSVRGESASRLPDLVLRWDRGFDFGALSLRGVTQELRLKGEGIDATKRGWGLAASGLVKTRGRDFLVWGVTYGQGVGRYLNYVEGAMYDPAKDEIVLEKDVGGYAGYQLKVSDLLRFNFAYGFTACLDGGYTDLAKAVGADGTRFGVNRWVQQGHAGFFLSPVPATDFGLEAIVGARKTLDGQHGEDFRLNFLARYYVN
jgi:DcaP outer membrane protein